MGTKLPFISIVIPAYNEEKYLPATLTAFKNQTYPSNRYGITIVDNNSKDNTAKIARQFRAKVITEKKQGHIFALDRGLRLAKGDIIAITDADTTVSETWLEDIATAFADASVMGITGSVVLDVESELKKAFFKHLYHVFLRFNFACHRPHIAGPNMAIRRSAFKKIKHADTRYKIGGDVELGMRLRKYGHIRFVEDVTVTTSSRRFKTDKKDFFKDMYMYTVAYFYAIWLVRPPRGRLVPVR